jgi:nitrogen fixation/metabolism regulation signal transduction histidine kinase
MMANETSAQSLDRTVDKAAASKRTTLVLMPAVKQAQNQTGGSMTVAGAASRTRPEATDDLPCCGRLLDTLCEYSRLPALERQQEQLWSIIADALRLMEDNLKTSGPDPHGIQVHCAVTEDIAVEVARCQIVRAIANVIQNAFEALADGPKEFRPGRITISAQMTEMNAIEIVIEDNGKGINVETLQGIQRFTPGRSTKKSQHCGLGLPIAKRHIQSHGGDIAIESCENKGTHVTIMLPRTMAVQGFAEHSDVE